MESNDSTETIITPEQWKARALKSERALYNINDQICRSSYVFGDAGDNSEEDMGDLGDAIWEAADINLDDDIPVPEDIARAVADRRGKVYADRVLYAVYDSRRADLGSVLAVGRAGQDSEARELLLTRWRELSPFSRKGNYGLRAVHVEPGRERVPGLKECDMRRILLESPAHTTPTIVAEYFTGLE